ncbi:MAG: DUF1634 domain-containing protein [Candidatus Korobacteraceae bacterium]
MSAKGWTDQGMEVIIGVLLRTGVLLAASVVLIGGVTYLVRHGGERANYSSFHGEPEGLKSIPGIAKGMAGLHGQAIIQFGLLLLIATPVARVAFSAVGFAMERDHMYVVVTLIVLAILLYSLFGSSG